MANSNISDVRPDAGISANVSPTTLPIRGEKRIISSPISPWDMNTTFEQAWEASGQVPPDKKGYKKPAARQQLVQTGDFNTTGALSPYTDYVVVRLYHRGLGGNGQSNGTPATYRFLINPSQVAVNRSTIDVQAFARSGWQIGVWGEDALSITLSGKTAGQYFAFGITDKYQPFTESYRNLEQLQAVFENNGYWFEGEQAGEGPLAAGFTRRLIKMHADVELTVGNFIWQGMFESLTITQSAETPFLMDFNLAFTAWKERYRPNSPYPDTIHNDVLRGHDYGAWKATANASQQQAAAFDNSPLYDYTPPWEVSAPQPMSTTVPPLQTPSQAPSVTSAQASNTFCQTDTTSNDTTYFDPALNLTPQNQGTWNGVISPLNYGNGGQR